MKKLWNDCEPLNFPDDEAIDAEGCQQEPAATGKSPGPTVKKRRSFLQRMRLWLFQRDLQEEQPAYLHQAPPGYDNIPPQRREEIIQALQQWKAATAYFESVSDPALVDYAVFDMEAAQKRYIYLLKSARLEQSGQTMAHP